ncbi:MAG TPA: hypothetical protein VMZ27_11170 [Candidatus Saccharimonadales bacterium]|nr:hypothetical protein [Candidatus Saccharimonadales bacterium]
MMSSLLKLVSETPDCSIVPWRWDPALRKIPPGCPADLAALAAEAYQFHLYEIPTEKGILTKPGSFNFDPSFEYTVAEGTFVDQEQYKDPATAGFTRCFTLGCFGAGNDQLILDLSEEQNPQLRYFYYYPVEALSSYPIVKMAFQAFIRACIEAGPDVRFFRELVDDQM